MLRAKARARAARLRVDYPRRGRGGVRRFLPSWRQVLGLALLCCGALAALVGYVYSTVRITDVNATARTEATVYYWADGSQMVSVGAVNRQNVPLSDIPVSLQNAVIATENAGFYTDPGFSVRGLARAVSNMAQGEEIQGGSTITQQYVKNTYLTQEQTLDRKLRELCLAVKLSRNLSKQDILQGYFNTSWFGRNAYGVQAASVAYYGLDAKELDPARGALLAALLKGGDLYDPSVSEAHHRRAVARWRYVLDRQVELGFMSPQERAKYTVFPEPRPRSASLSTSLSGQTGYLVDVANKYIERRTGLTAEDLGRGGYRVRTTFDRALVEQLERTVEDVTARSPEAGEDLQVGAASVRPDDGAVLAVYGGPDATEHFANNADTSGVPVGSAFRPFVLAAAVRDGGDPEDVEDGDARDVEPGAVRDVAVGAGLLPQSMAPLDRSFTSGTSTPSAVRMADAYATFANGGRHTDLYAVTAISHQGKPLEGLERPGEQQVLDGEVADEVVEQMRDVAVNALDPGALRTVGPVAAGRTDAGDGLPAAWFVGATEEMSTAVTVFRAEPGKDGLLPLTGGEDLPLGVWSSYMTTIQ
ncbi:transglycosylase domain-containing protein [Streptomyces sp. NPDC006307]|uniref:transglycosylase domain-containing protein n=1 Tax=Streptomyces sp. NPDC006307 TaxID=3156748 RepID=UPI0033B73E6B